MPLAWTLACILGVSGTHAVLMHCMMRTWVVYLASLGVDKKTEL